MNKKGFLLGEYTLKIIIAVLCISLLLYLLFVLYGSYNDEKELGQAKATLNEIVEEMGVAKESGETQKVILLNPSMWQIIGFEEDAEILPEICSRVCLCVCKLGGEKIENCNNGACHNLEKGTKFSEEPFIVIPSISRSSPKEIEIKYFQEEFTITEK